jgi:hypothetical protein
VPAFAGNQVFRVERRGLIAFLKLAAREDLERELAVLRLLDALGVPVPAIEAADQSGELAGTPCVLLRQAEGEPAQAGSPEFAASGALLRRVHEVAVGGCTRWRSAGSARSRPARTGCTGRTTPGPPRCPAASRISSRSRPPGWWTGICLTGLDRASPA